MSSKHERNTGEWKGPRRLPSVREKLSGFVRRGREKAKKTTLSVLGESRQERPSLDESMKALPRVQVSDFGTSSLEIDLQSLEAFRIAPSQPARGAEQARQVKKTSSRTSTITPIADMFARKATTAALSTVDMRSLNKSSPSLLTSVASSKPAEARRPGQAPSMSSRAAAAPSTASSVVIVNSSSTGQPQSHPSKPWPPPETPRAAAAPIRTQFPTASTSNSDQPNKLPLREPPRRAAFVPAYVLSRAAPIVTPAEPVIRPHHQNADAVARQQRLQHNTEKRHSNPTGMPSSSTTTATAPAPNKLLLAEIVNTDRRRSWQPAPTSVPSASGTPTSSGPPSASAPWRGRDLDGSSTKRASSRIASDRLAWIRELEEGKKKKSTINGDLPVLRNMQGSVADKLAKFEQQKQQQQMQQQVPLTRSNSTRSRISSVADTTFSSYNGPATARSSLDTCRTSSVFSHYDDSFREKMEIITGATNKTADEENEEKPALNKVTSTFVSIEKKEPIAAPVDQTADDEGTEKPALEDVAPASPTVEKIEPTTADAPIPAEVEIEAKPALIEVPTISVSSETEKMEPTTGDAPAPADVPLPEDVEVEEKPTLEEIPSISVSAEKMKPIAIDADLAADEAAEEKPTVADVPTAIAPASEIIEPTCVDKPQPI
ncbi:hypothetical protein BDP81DRAFT_399356 [Colletotrichum phormii]|uniref:Altered inheritance of mitochondria protein 21 n=1 Tax=Colletotrichum phormii TaxID=359342 RepID=A0AAI9ZHJ7_9PEZI|nr:uncharacterized protein BDP81DRAFT_399356 [Colletotrichum phormii]KAK1623680.1 hypothetical protein BDP81DRAFT_399356 [Colletotrichum phormii]